jgi:hypothetical protein
MHAWLWASCSATRRRVAERLGHIRLEGDPVIPRRVHCVLYGLLGVLISAYASRAMAADGMEYRTGDALTDALAEQARWSVVGTPLGTQLSQWERQAAVAMVRDRRLDPQRAVTLETGLASRRQLLQSLSAAVPGTGWSVTDRCVYFGPAAAARRLPLLVELQRERLAKQRRRIPSADYRRRSTLRPVRWERLAEPRQIVLALAQPAGVTIENPEQIPHDVWDAAVWPDMTFSDAATVVLNQFDLMLSEEDEAGSVRVTAIDLSLTLERAYVFGAEHRPLLTRTAHEKYPDLALKWTAGTLRVTAALDQHLWFEEQWEQTQQVPTSTGAPTAGSLLTRKFTLKVEHVTLGQLIASFRSSGILLDVIDAEDPALQAVLKQEVSLDLNSVGAESFFGTVFGAHFETVSVTAERVVLALRRRD